MIQNYVKDICRILEIKVPVISYDTSNFPTDTMMAQCSPDGTIVYIKKYDRLNPDQFFAIAHELRHIWQMKNEPIFLSDYKPIKICNSIEEYNLQMAELDANAFAGIVMNELFYLKPLFNGVPESVKSKIFERMETIIITEFS